MTGRCSEAERTDVFHISSLKIETIGANSHAVEVEFSQFTAFRTPFNERNVETAVWLW
jgi:hypothetical protein